MGRQPLPRLLKGVLVSLTTLGVCGALAVGCFALHYTLTPSFDEYVRTVRAPDSIVPADPVKGVLSSDGSWSAGGGDPFTGEHGKRHESVSEFELKRGDDELLSLRQEFAVAFDGNSNDRSSFATRNGWLRVHPGFRAVVRVWVRDPERVVGRDSASRGAVTIEAWLLAGGGPSDVRVIADPKQERWNDGTAVESVSASLLGDLDPFEDLPPDGMVYHFEHEVELTAGRYEGQAWSNSQGNVQFTPSTDEYSFAMRHALTQGGGVHGEYKSTVTRAQRKELNGRVW